MIRGKRAERPPRLRAFLAALLLVSLPAAGGEAEGPLPLSRRLPAAVADAQRVVERVRGVAFKGTVASALLPEKELPKVLEVKLLEDLPVPFETYAASIAAVGLIDPVPDLARKIVNLYSRQVVGFYDPKEKRFYVVPERTAEAAASPQEGLADGAAMVEEALLVHELTHALQDQRLDLARRMKELRGSTDALLALQAFLEGEATVVMAEALLERVPEEARELLPADSLAQMVQGMQAAGASAMDGADGVPDYFVKELLFPYVAGTAWIQRRRGEPAAGGSPRPPAERWAGIEAVYRRPPQTTSELLHPTRPAPFRLRLPETSRPKQEELPADSRLLYSDSFGEWVLRTLLERAGAGEAAAALAAGWQDDRILFFEPRLHPGHQIGFVWRIRLATAEDADALGAALEPLYTGRPLPARAVVRVEGDVVEVSRGLLARPPAEDEVKDRPAPSAPPGGSGRAGSR